MDMTAPTFENSQSYLDAARKLREEGSFLDCFMVLEEGLKHHPENAQLWYKLGQYMHATRTMDDKVMACFTNAYVLAPMNRGIAMDFALFLTQKNRHDMAEAVYHSVYRADDNKVIILTALGSHYQKRDMIGLATACFYKAATDVTGDKRSSERYCEMKRRYGASFDEADWLAFKDRAASRRVPAPAHL